MSLAYDTNDSSTTPEYASRTEIHYMFRVPMYAIARAVDKGKLKLHLIDGKIFVKVAEAEKIFGKGKTDLFR
jgi:hypothetical protein